MSKNNDNSNFYIILIILLVIAIYFWIITLIILLPFAIMWIINRNKSKKQELELKKRFENEYVILDIETTGLDKYKDEIIEISAIKIKNSEIVDTYNILVNPIGKMSKTAMSINKITPDMVENAPRMKNIINDIVDFIGSSLVIGYNVDFDITFLSRDAKMNNIVFEPYYIDVMEYCKKYLKLDRYRLIDVANHFGIANKQTHRALDDCKLLNECYKQLNYQKMIIHKYKLLIDTSFINFRVDISRIKPNINNIDSKNCFYGKKCVVTGNFKEYEREDIYQLLVNKGAILLYNVTTKTNFLICGSIETGKTKLNKAKEFIKSGQDIKILSEFEFMELAEINNEITNKENLK